MSGALAAMIGLSGAPGVINGALPDSTSSVGGAGFELQNDGDCVASNGAGTGTVDWVTPSDTTTAAYYEAKVDATAGSFSSGTTGTWLALSSSRSWTINTGSVTFNVSIREAVTGLVRTTQSVTMSAP